jgi:AAA domain
MTSTEPSAERNGAYTPPRAPTAQQSSPPGWQWDLIDSATFARGNYRPEWMVKRLVVHQQPMVIGGMEKTLKTTMGADLAVSVSAGVPFLGRFDVYRKRSVAFISGESGAHTLQETFFRIARARGVNPADCDVHWGFTLPSLADLADVDTIESGIRDYGIGLMMIDPAYLATLKGADPDAAKNMFYMGPILAQFAEACIRAGATPAVIHHANRTLPAGEMMELHHLSYSGFAHYARQWLLLSRMKRYEGEGRHDLVLNAGGSCGQGGLYAITIDEGTLGEDFGGRTWDVMVEPAGEYRQRAEEEREAAKQKKAAEREEKKEQAKAEKIAKDAHVVHERFLKLPGSKGTGREVRDALRWSGVRFGHALLKCLNDGRLKHAKVPGTVGATKKATIVDGFMAVIGAGEGDG